MSNHLQRYRSRGYKRLPPSQISTKVFLAADENMEVISALPSLYENMELEEAKEDAEKGVRNVVKLLMGAAFTPKAISWKLVKAVLFSQNPKWLQAFTNELQHVSTVLYEQLTTNQLDERQEHLAEILFGNILALHPFAEPKNGSSLIVPQKIDGQWELVEYRVEVLPLTPSWLGSAVPALGLLPKSSAQAHPLLLFRGTPQPTASGAFLAVASDAVPRYSVGEFIYEHSAKNTIQEWVKKAAGASENKAGNLKKVNLYGQSLGGSLSLLTACHQPEYIGDVHVYGSPGLLSYPLKCYDEKKKEGLDSIPNVHIYWNHGDLVPLVGKFHPDWNLHQVITEEPQHSLFAHAALNAASVKQVAIMKLDVNTANARTARKVMNVAHRVLSFLITVFITLPVIGFKASLHYISKACQKVCAVAKRIFARQSSNRAL